MGITTSHPTGSTPHQKTWQMRFDLQDDLRWQLREQADRRRISVQAALVEAVAGWIAQRNQACTAPRAESDEEEVSRG